MNIHAYGAMQNMVQSTTPSDFKGRVMRDGLPSHLRLQEGDGLLVTVVRSDGDSMTLRTEDGFQFSARQSGTPLPVGQTLELTVTQSTPQALTVEITDKSSVNLRALLESFDAEPTPENVDLANEILRQGAEPTKAVFQKLQSIMSIHKSLSPEQAVFMLRHGIPVSPKTVKQFQGFLQHQSQLGRQLGRLLDIFDSLEPRTAEPSVAAQSKPQPQASATPQAQNAQAQASAPEAAPSQQPQDTQPAQPQAPEAAAPQAQNAQAQASAPEAAQPQQPQATQPAQPQAPEAAAPQAQNTHPQASAPEAAQPQQPQATQPAQPQAPEAAAPQAQNAQAQASAPEAAQPQQPQDTQPAQPQAPEAAVPQAQNAQPQASVPETTQSQQPQATQTAQPQAPEAAVPQAQNAQPQVSAPETAPSQQPQATQTAQPQAPEAAVPQAQNTQPQASAPEAAQSQQPQTTQPAQPQAPEAIAPQAQNTQESQPQGTLHTATQAAQPQTTAQETAQPQTQAAATGQPQPAQDTQMQSASPAQGAQASQSQNAAPVTSQPVTSQPVTSQPEAAQSQTAQPKTSQTQPAQPQPQASQQSHTPSASQKASSFSQGTTAQATYSNPQARSPSTKASHTTAETTASPIQTRALHAASRFPAPARSEPSAKLSEARRDSSLRSLTESLFKDVDALAAPTRDLRAARLRGELSELLQAVERRAHELPAAQRQEVVKTAREIEQNVKFMEHINNFASYMQIPVQVGSQRSTAELYVFNDSRGQKRIDPENATVFISLDTAHLGQVETFVKLIGKHVECDFSLEDERTASVFSSSMQSLSEALTALGYTLMRTSAKAAEAQRNILDVDREHLSILEKYTVNRVV